MKQFVTILLFSLFLVQNFSSYCLIADYWLNKSFVAKNLCENRNKPYKHCDGKCYLHKQLAKENKQDNNSSDGVKIKVENTAYLLQETTEHFNTFINHAPPQYEQYIASLLPGIGKPVFHPPLA